MGLHLKLVNISKLYEDVLAFSPLHLNIQAGESLALIGPSGCGKSTLLNILGLMDRPSSGHYWLNGQDTERLTFKQKSVLRNEKIGFMFQFYHLLKGWSVVDNVALPLLYRGWSYQASQKRASQWIERLGLSELHARKTHSLSGGQQQRVALARALVIEPELLLLDEPTASLDNHRAHQLMTLILDWQQKLQFTLVLVSHDPTIQSYCTKSIELAHDAIPTALA